MAATQSVSQNPTTVHRQPEVKFGKVVLHRVSVYITWPREPACSSNNASTVVGYRLRYQAVDDADEFIARQLTDNFVLLENVQTSVHYRFQVKYVFVDGSETDWSGDGLVDTTPLQRQPVTNWTHLDADLSSPCTSRVHVWMHDGHKPWPWRPQQSKREKQTKCIVKLI